MRWIATMTNFWKSRFTSRSTRRADEALKAADEAAKVRERALAETVSGAERLDGALRELKYALQGRAR